MAAAKVPAAEPAKGSPPATKLARAKRSQYGTRKPRQSRAKGGASLYKDVAETIGCPNITEETVQLVCQGLRKALIREVREHGTFKIYGICTFKLKHMHGRPARLQKVYDLHTNTMVEKDFAARPPYKKVSGRVLAPLQNLFRDSSEGSPAPCVQ